MQKEKYMMRIFRPDAISDQMKRYEEVVQKQVNRFLDDLARKGMTYRIINVDTVNDPRGWTDPGTGSFYTVLHIAYWE